ncbi:MAG: hypothetical protein AB1846_00395 [Chloroflexota bacterium]
MKRLQIPLLVIVIALSATLAYATLTFGHLWGDDFASYIMQAASITGGSMDEFVRRNTFTMENSSYPVGPVAYPWGYPLLLAPVYALRGVMPLALKMVNLPAFAVFLAAYFFFLKRRVSGWESLLLVAAFAFNATFLSYHDQIISDIAFTAVSTLALWSLDRTAFDGSPKRGWGILAGALIFSAYFLRTVGILLLAALLVYRGYKLLAAPMAGDGNGLQSSEAREESLGGEGIPFAKFKNLRALRAFAVKNPTISKRAKLLPEIWPFVTFALLWILASLVFPSGEGSYFSHYGLFDYGQRLRENFVAYFSMGAEFFDGLPARTVVYGLALAFFLIGFVHAPETDLVAKLYFAATMLLYLTWPEPQGIRFLFPLLPVFVYFSFLGMKASFFGLSARYRQMGLVLTYAFWGAVVAFMLLASANQALANLGNARDIKGPFDPFAREMVNFVEATIPQDSVIVFFKPRAMRLLTGRDSILMDRCEDLDRGDYVILDLDRGEYADVHQLTPGQVKKCGLPVTNIFENRKFLVFRLEK